MAVNWEGNRVCFSEHTSRRVYLLYGGQLQALVYVADAGSKEVLRLSP